MADPDPISQEMQQHYESLWQAGDPWAHECSRDQKLDLARLAAQRKLLAGRRYGRVLEVGCGNGTFTRELAGIADRVLALDIAASAVERTREATAGAGPGTIEFRVANILEYDLEAEGPWDLVVFAETIYCLGWLYPMFRVAWFATRLFNATAVGGRLLLANTFGEGKGMSLLVPHLVRTYHDLFRNVGYRLETEVTLTQGWFGSLQVLVSLYEKASRHGG
jgi:SAM-dependent methyltransferase